jgi:hypothetical protein
VPVDRQNTGGFDQAPAVLNFHFSLYLYEKNKLGTLKRFSTPSTMSALRNVENNHGPF